MKTLSDRYACGRKHGFKDRATAFQEALRIGRIWRDKVEPYHCGLCQAWHVGKPGGHYGQNN